ncbi:MAG: T9SS type A sorting domain-containing protein [Bacteroidia bacterium]|nr:T9SS type A sorting domain-containing protein [Bacteroidia bacterium]
MMQYFSPLHLDKPRQSGMYRSSFLTVLFLAMCLLGSMSAFAVNKSSKATGAWTDANNWNPVGVPTAADDVTILSGHTVTMPSVGVALTECNNLTIEAGAILTFLSRDHTTHGTTSISGQLMDTQNAGANIFTGTVTITATGSWNTTSVSNVNNIVFRGGIDYNGVSFIVNKCTFNTNDQTISGTSPLSFPGTVSIGSGISVTNNNSAGLTFGPVANLTGVDGTSTFINQTTFTYQHKNAPMLIGIADFTPVGNTVIYNRNGIKQAILGTTYYNLTIAPDPLLSNFNHEATGNITATNFEIQNGAEFLIEGFDLNVTGNTLIEGIFTDSDLIGTNTLNNLELANGGDIDGSGVNHGTFNVGGTFDVTAGTATLNEAILTVTGITTISAGATLILNSQHGTKTFGQVNVAATGTFNVGINNNATTAIFTGPFTNNGTLNAQKGSYTFQDIFTNSATGSSNVLSDGFFLFQSDFMNFGTGNLADGIYTFQNTTIGGTSPILINGDIFVDAGFTTINSNTGGFILNGVLNGVDVNSVFRNEQSFTYNPALRNVPMSVGSLDASTVGNTFRYSRTGSDQDIKGTTYHHLVFENGTVRTLNDGNVTVNGNLTNSISQVGAGIITFAGTGAQTLAGGGSFLNLAVNKPSGSLTVTSDIVVSTSLTITNGLVITGANTIDLGTAGTISETTTSYVFGFVEVERSMGGGSVNNFGGIGLTITSSPGNPLGATTVIRNNATALLSGAINRSFIVTPTTNAALNASLEFNYLDADINGLTEANFVLLNNTGGGFVNIGGSLNAGANQMTLSGISSFGSLTLGDPASFPVEWLNFQAVASPVGVELNWSTAFELNNDYFAIERSIDGNLFSAIGQVKGVGTTSEISDYSFTDRDALNLNGQVLYYRLKQVDNNGQFDYSNIVEIRLNSSASLELKAFPSPFSEELTIQLFLNDRSGVSNLKLTDMSGKVLWSKIIATDSGTYNFTVPASNLASGIYTVVVQSGDTVKYVRVIK